MTIHQLHSLGHDSMPSTWQERLANTDTEGDVVSVARDYIAQFTPEEVSHLPDACKPTKVVDGNDVSDYALTLVRQHCDDGEGSMSPIHRLAAFFSNASVRLTEIMHKDAQRQSA